MTIDNSREAIPQITYSEGLKIDYRWYFSYIFLCLDNKSNIICPPRFDFKAITPRYEFGSGLSYTTFTYSDLSIHPASKANSRSVLKSSVSALFRPEYSVDFTVTNTGEVAGNEVSQLYLGFPESAGEPPQVLRGMSDLISPVLIDT